MSQVLKQIEQMLAEAQRKRSWGSVEVDFKDGEPYLVRQTIQSKPKPEDLPYETLRK
jgi:uncharacterized radical SAM superfamily Fe-S cluster-containing enzyme